MLQTFYSGKKPPAYLKKIISAKIYGILTQFMHVKDKVVPMLKLHTLKMYGEWRLSSIHS
jgi:hypothetical protein